MKQNLNSIDCYLINWPTLNSQLQALPRKHSMQFEMTRKMRDNGVLFLLNCRDCSRTATSGSVNSIECCLLSVHLNSAQWSTFGQQRSNNLTVISCQGENFRKFITTLQNGPNQLLNRLNGINAVQATCTVIVEMITNSALLNSVTFRISGLTMNSFLNPTAYGRLLDSLSALIPSDRRDVLIFSVRQDNELHGEPTLNVSLVLRKANSDRFLRYD
ncbi:putative cadherin EGF LAG seven-pass G-type receptor 3 [Trichinella spiralis]|uniref:putative cadherin EGF LAG seven-pass G-type receptor 3 n=1 Tax=Trichinella spiralis TaxID=6334 RepID=UPI0001EFB1FA|nr:putative cadherin EGF LAG seven-pass G-type receptor 3 [Trichinella spiralis]